VYQSTLNNCTLTGNSANSGFECSGGGASGCMLNNCIVYFNTAPNGANYDVSSSLSYCCTTPLPTNGLGNIFADPQLANASHLSVLSPCRGAGSAAYATGTDIDGEPWTRPPSMGCDEYHEGTVTGPLNARIGVTFTNVAVGFPVGLTALVNGRTTVSAWDFGDGTVELDQPYTTHAWTAPGDYLVALWCFNETYPEGVSATVTIRVILNPLQYVAAGSTNPVAPYTSWATATPDIQDAVDAGIVGGQVLVGDGTYAIGRRAVAGGVTNRVVAAKPMALRSVNGPQFTVIDGGQTVRCVYLGDGASLSGFTLTNGTADNGGGVWCVTTTTVISNCVIAGNSADDGGGCIMARCFSARLAATRLLARAGARMAAC